MAITYMTREGYKKKWMKSLILKQLSVQRYRVP